MAKRLANSSQGPIGSEAHVGWAQYADGGTWQLFEDGYQPEGERPDFYQDARRARGAFLSWASRNGFTVSAPMVLEGPAAGHSFEITAHKRRPAQHQRAAG